ncbi:hypothetical protein shim_32130 [Shimia sp. SK013]|uniref:hypothetical protein n=1 Tax=Shimia sp. SK013 TaxID=1389006 RepID=UPI0006CE1CC8|nr:hypothetical protein [Shimia sp. SK013]KPA20610.1 hypothetical protein shim_32130 [Shimia sp. SK013]
MATWTFIVEFGGGTYCSQFHAERLQDAVLEYNRSDPSEQGAIPLDADAVELTGLKNIFGTSGLTEKDEQLILASIVKTEISK